MYWCWAKCIQNCTKTKKNARGEESRGPANRGSAIGGGAARGTGRKITKQKKEKKVGEGERCENNSQLSSSRVKKGSKL